MNNEIKAEIELREIYEKWAEPSLKSAVRRIEALTSLMEKSRKDEKCFNWAHKRLIAYEAVEDNYNYRRSARDEFEQ